MRAIFILIFSLLVGCQSTKDQHSSSNQNNKKNRNSNNTAIYDRYKNNKNRYTIQQDAAPKSQKTLNLNEPKPQQEPLSRYGNPSEYKVAGHSYEIMQNPSGYKKRGIASWYGTKFHKQRTSSGEPYNMYVMTAAHKTLPLPTYVRVKNLDNGRVAVVKVNDRGPFHSDRIIDLSYAAALKLGVFPKGTAHVEIETLSGPSNQPHYYLQAGAFVSEFSAKQLKAKIARLTSSPVFIEHYKQHYVVRVGPFGKKAMSDQLKMKLAKNGLKNTFSVLI